MSDPPVSVSSVTRVTWRLQHAPQRDGARGSSRSALLTAQRLQRTPLPLARLLPLSRGRALLRTGAAQAPLAAGAAAADAALLAQRAHARGVERRLARLAPAAVQAPAESRHRLQRAGLVALQEHVHVACTEGGANETNQSSRGGVWTPLLTSSIISRGVSDPPLLR